MKELGVNSTNCYPKSSFVKNDEVYVGCFERELKEDFYFYNTFDKKLYVLRKPDEKELINWERETFNNKEKLLIPLKSSKIEVIWEDKPYEELPDETFNSMTKRQYACIHLKIPESGITWLDELIKRSRS